MASFEYNPIAEFVSLRFTCPDCGEECISEAFSVPSPDFSAENHSDSINSESYETECQHCGHQFEVSLYTGIYGGEGEISDVDGLLQVEEEFADNDDYEDEYQEWYNATHTEVEKAIDAIEELPEEIRTYLYRLLYTNAITSMETFLGDTLKREVLNSDDMVRKFVENYIPFKKIEIKLSNLFTKKDRIKNDIQEELSSLLYHDLGKIKPIYKAILGIDLGDIKDLNKAVQNRHDLVHRNGQTKDGKSVIISKDDVLALSNKVQELISTVNRQLIPDHPMSILPELMFKDDNPFDVEKNPDD